MVFEAHYSKWRQIALAVVGLGFAALGWWLATLPAEELEGSSARKLAGLAGLFGTSTATMAVIIGGLCVMLGVALIPVVIKNLQHGGPALRVDRGGLLSHRWSDRPIPWSNIAAAKPYTLQGQKFVAITLIDRDHNPATTFAGRMAGLNRSIGAGDLALSVQGTDGRYDDLVAALDHYVGQGARG